MKKSRFSDSQVMAILKQHETGFLVAELAWKHNVRTSLTYQWRSKLGGMDAWMMKRLLHHLRACSTAFWLSGIFVFRA